MNVPRPEAVRRNWDQALLHTWSLVRAGDLAALNVFLDSLPAGAVVEEPELGVHLLANHLHSARTAEARQVERLLEPVFRDRPNDRLLRRFINLQGSLLSREGALSRAEERLRELEWLSLAAGDETTLGYSLANAGIVADIRCDYAAALLLHERALTLTRRAGAAREVGSCHHHLGMTYRQLGMYSESYRHFENSLHYPMSPGDLAGRDLERAILQHLTGNAEVARTLGQRAYERFRSLPSTAGMADAMRVLGMITADADAEQALRTLNEAQALVPTSEPLDRAEILEELAVVHAMLGHTVESLEAETQAASVYEGMEAPRRAERMRVRLAVIGVGKRIQAT